MVAMPEYALTLLLYGLVLPLSQLPTLVSTLVTATPAKQALQTLIGIWED